MNKENEAKKDKKEAEWKPDPKITMDIKKGDEWKPDPKITMRLKESAEKKEENKDK
jgi:hypothetical protein